MLKDYIDGRFEYLPSIVSFKRNNASILSGSLPESQARKGDLHHVVLPSAHFLTNQLPVSQSQGVKMAAPARTAFHLVVDSMWNKKPRVTAHCRVDSITLNPISAVSIPSPRMVSFDGVFYHFRVPGVCQG